MEGWSRLSGRWNKETGVLWSGLASVCSKYSIGIGGYMHAAVRTEVYKLDRLRLDDMKRMILCSAQNRSERLFPSAYI